MKRGVGLMDTQNTRILKTLWRRPLEKETIGTKSVSCRLSTIIMFLAAASISLVSKRNDNNDDDK